MEKIVLAQILAHIIADFFAQPEYLSRKKQTHFLRSTHIYIHALIAFAAAVALTFTGGFVLWAATIAVSHLAIDVMKCSVERKIKNRKKIPDDILYGNHALFFIDQLLHIVVIYATVLFYSENGGSVPGYLDIFTPRQLLLAICFLLCLKPANVLIRVCLSSFISNPQIQQSLDDEGLQRAGRWIGSIERSMTFIMVILGQYTAIGFIIAAKSVLRYGENGHRTEYVLIGTLLSFGIAFILGTVMTSGIFETIANIISFI